jgi:hypothetical protein
VLIIMQATAHMRGPSVLMRTTTVRQATLLRWRTARASISTLVGIRACGSIDYTTSTSLPCLIAYTVS